MTQVPDLADALAAEAEAWLQDLRRKGITAHAFIGITSEDRKFLLQLVDSSLDRIDILQFLRWLCRSQQVVAYTYVTHVGKLTIGDDSEFAEEAIHIFASSALRDVDVVLTITRHGDGSISYDRSHASSRAVSKDLGSTFLGLQRSTAGGDCSEITQFEKIWSDLEPWVVWFKKKEPRWIIFALGPSVAVPGLREHFEHYQDCWNRAATDRDGNLVLDEKAKVWEDYDKGSARDCFIGKEQPTRFESVVSSALGTKFRLRDRYVPSLFEAAMSALWKTDFHLNDAFLSTGNIRDKWVTMVTIRADQMVYGPPGRWPPDKSSMEALLHIMISVEAREWIEYWLEPIGWTCEVDERNSP